VTTPADGFIVATMVDESGVAHDEFISLADASDEALWYAVVRGDQNAADELAARVLKPLEDAPDPERVRKEMQE
jgi:hypothetical protein